MVSIFRSWPVAAALVGSLACGGGGGSPPPTGPPPPPPGGGASTTASVSMNSSTDQGYEVNSFNPASVTIARNGTVTWLNPTGVSHNVTFKTSGSPANVGNHTSGSTARSFPAAGTFNYDCTNHSGMTGSVTVQ